MGRQRKPAAVESKFNSDDDQSEVNEFHQDSQDQITVNALKAARSVVSVGKKRSDSQRKAVEEQHKKRLADVTGRMEAYFEGRKVTITQLQDAQWARLEGLNKRREQIEGQIIASIKSIEIHTANISSGLAAVYEGRIEEMEEISNISP